VSPEDDLTSLLPPGHPAEPLPDDWDSAEAAFPQNRATYAIGDVQGCFDDLLRLLDKINFDPDQDQLWFTGDLVNRGPDSLELLRFVKGLGSAAISVLGNHDLYLLAVAAGAIHIKDKDTFTDILLAADCEELLFWLRHQPLLHHDERLGYTMVHAGILPQWSLAQAKRHAAELEEVLQNFHYEDFFHNWKGHLVRKWKPDLDGWKRLHFIASCFTQMRYCDRKGQLDLKKSHLAGKRSPHSMPWFQVPKRAMKQERILFGHWAALEIKRKKWGNVFPLDTGCANGGRFTAYQLEDGLFFQIQCKNEGIPWSNSESH
jgi:bis(5'-nucleosyl)-tetraphosphatase (symmetrical)